MPTGVMTVNVGFISRRASVIEIVGCFVDFLSVVIVVVIP